MTFVRRILVSSAAVALSACVATNAALVDTSLHLQRTCPAAVRIYTSPSRVGTEYQEVALLNSAGLSNWTDESGMMTSMRNKAAELGATGIIMGNINEASAGAKVAAAVFGMGTERRGKAVAIYVPADLDRARAACADAFQSAPAATTGTRATETSRPLVTPVERAAIQKFPVDRRSTESSGLHAQAGIGAPLTETDRVTAVRAFEDGSTYLGAHEWAKAEQSYQLALLHDGSVAKYHAALGALMMTLHRWVDAEASYSAAVLIDVDNAEYRRLLKEARARR
jgi:hypothetical protein